MSGCYSTAFCVSIIIIGARSVGYMISCEKLLIGSIINKSIAKGLERCQSLKFGGIDRDCLKFHLQTASVASFLLLYCLMSSAGFSADY